MLIRLLLCGVCAIALHSGSGLAQTFASVTDNPIADKPMAVDQTSKPGQIPEIIKEADPNQNDALPKAVSDPSAALQPPEIDLRFLRAIRLDWDRLDASENVLSRHGITSRTALR